MIGVVADDITGSGDVGIMYAKSGLTTDIYSYDAARGWRPEAAADVYVLDTDSRFDGGSEAYDKVRRATEELRNCGCASFFKKTCSAFRGNVGAELDGMLDALGAEFAVVVLGFPKNGRTTRDGIHYIGGVRLEDSQFRRDPVHPMTDSDLVRILAGQTKRPVSLIDWTVVARGAEAIADAVERQRGRGGYVVVDVADQRDLAVIAEAIRDEKVVGGASAIAEELARLNVSSGLARGNTSGEGQAADAAGVALRPRLGIPVFAGSLMPQTAAQVAFFRSSGAPSFLLDPALLLTEAARAGEIDRLSAAMTEAVAAGADPLLHSENRPEKVEETKRQAVAAGMSNTEISRLVSSAVAEIADRVLAAAGQNQIVVAGGDTSAAVCARLGIDGMRVGREIEPGLPICMSLSDSRPLALVLKSGSFGGDDFFRKAIRMMKTGTDRDNGS